jgi:hypothetical protein
MSCNCRTHDNHPPASLPQPPCLPCAIEHLERAEEAAGHGRRHLAVWHLARAAELAPAAARALRTARLDYQRHGRTMDWNHLRGLIE